MKNSISPYPQNVKVNASRQIFRDNQYLGYIDKVQNWGTDFLARPENGNNKFFTTQTAAVKYILEIERIK